MMSLITAALGVLAVLIAAGFYVSWRATRLDRLHARIDTAMAALDAALIRRCAWAQELAASGLLDPAASILLSEAEQDARIADGSRERQLAESRLSQVLRAVRQGLDRQPAFGLNESRVPGVREDLLTGLDTARRNVAIARLFYNDSVSTTLSARRKALAKVLRLAGNAPIPVFFEMDDDAS